MTLPGPSVNSHMQYFDACSPVPLMLSHRLVPHMMPAGEQAQKAAAFTDIGTELNHGFARVKKLMRTMHYGLYAVLLLMLSVLLSVASPVSLSALTGLIPRACIRRASIVWWRMLSSCVSRRGLRICCCGF